MKARCEDTAAAPPYISKFAIKHLDLNNNVMRCIHTVFLCCNLANIVCKEKEKKREVVARSKRANEVSNQGMNGTSSHI